jgi:hypothetical protein
LKDKNGSVTAHEGGVGYLGIAFPVTQRFYMPKDTSHKKQKVQWGMGLGLNPHSRTAYEIAYATTTNLPYIDTVNYYFKGVGQRYQIHWANGFNYKGFSVGLDISYLFGKGSNNRSVEFSELNYAYDDNFLYTQNVKGFIFTGGLHHTYTFDSPKLKNVPLPRRQYLNLVTGLTISQPSKLKTNTDLNYLRYTTNYGSDIDTLRSEVNNTSGSITLPTKIGFGLALKRDFKWMLGMNLEYESWAKYKSSIQNDAMRNTISFSVGAEYMPDYRAFRQFFKRNFYRVGFSYSQDPRIINGLTSNKMAVHFGLGTPLSLRNLPSFVNWGFEFGKMGNKNLLTDNYFRVSLGFTLNDERWFVRQKIK